MDRGCDEVEAALRPGELPCITFQIGFHLLKKLGSPLRYMTCLYTGAGPNTILFVSELRVSKVDLSMIRKKDAQEKVGRIFSCKVKSFILCFAPTKWI